MPEIRVIIKVRDLQGSDLEAMGWSGSASHIASVRKYLARVRTRQVDYLVACAPSGAPIGKVGIDYTLRGDAGMICQAAVDPSWQSCGIGTMLVSEAEQRMRDRGLEYSELSVEIDNPRAHGLCERLGYVAYGEEPDEWDAEGPDGAIVRYRTMCTSMRKPLQTWASDAIELSRFEGACRTPVDQLGNRRRVNN